MGRTTITLWTDDPYSNEGVAAIRKVTDGFEKANPDIEVKWMQQTPTSYYEKLLVAFAGGVGPDVFYIRPGMDSSYQRQGLTYDINPLVERDKMELNVSDFLEPQLRELKIGGKWWCLPYDYSSLVLAYNADAFDNAGLLPPSPAWTWDNVIDAGNKIMRRDSSGKITFWGFGGMGGFLSDWCEGFIMSFGGRLFNDELTKSVASSLLMHFENRASNSSRLCLIWASRCTFIAIAVALRNACFLLRERSTSL